MSRHLVSVALVAAALSVLPAEMSAAGKVKSANDEITEGMSGDRSVENCTLYVFGVSFSFSDSLVYMTDIQTMEDMTVKSNYFLEGNEAYSNQLKIWLENGGSERQVSSLYFFKKSSKADRKYEKVRNRVIRKRGRTVITIPEFKFSKI